MDQSLQDLRGPDLPPENNQEEGTSPSPLKGFCLVILFFIKFNTTFSSHYIEFEVADLV